MRKNYINNLRWIAILLLVPYHAAMAWNVWGEPNYIFFESNKLISSIVVFLSPYFMPLLFLLAGISTKFALQKRTVKQYISERAKKLLIPFLFGTLLLMPLMTYIADKFNFGYDGNLFEHYRVFFTKFTDLTGADGGFSLGQFWFILYLFAVSIIAVGIVALQKKVIPECNKNIPIWLICVLGLPLPLFSELLSIGGKSIAEYTYIFLIGYYVFSNDSVISKIEKYKFVFLSIGLASAIINVYLFIWNDVQYPLLNTAAKFISEWFMLISLLGIGKWCLNTRSKVSAYMVQRSFAFYILHFIWVVLFQYFMSCVCPNNIVLLYIIPVVMAYGAAFASCEICVRIPFLCSVMGIKYIMKENDIPDGILHDQDLCDISLQNNELILTFETHYYPQDYSDTTYAEKYKDFTKCHIKCTLGDRYFCNAILKSTLDKNNNFKGKYISIEDFVKIIKEELKNKNRIEYLETHTSPNINSALIELSAWIKYKRVKYSMCTLELETEEIEFIWE